MNVIPKSGADWLSVFLIPFKVFVPAGYLMVVIERDLLGYRMDTGAIVQFVLFGYMASFLALVVGGMIQYRIGARKAYLSTCAFVVGTFVFGALLLPYLAHT